MSPKIAIVTDSTCDLPEQLRRDMHIHVVPMRIRCESLEYRDGVDITAERVYELLEQNTPETVHPSDDDVTGLLDGLVDEGYTDVICLSVSSGVSDACTVMQRLLEHYSDIHATVVDTASVSMGLGFLALEAAREAQRTQDAQAVVDHVERIRARMGTFFVMNSLDYLKIGGRIGKVDGAPGALPDVKPIIGIGPDGVCHTLAKARGFRNSIQKMLAMIRGKYEGKRIHVAIVHGSSAEEADRLLDAIRGFAVVSESYVVQVCPALGVHTGPGLLGAAIYEAEATADQ